MEEKKIEAEILESKKTDERVTSEEGKIADIEKKDNNENKAEKTKNESINHNPVNKEMHYDYKTAKKKNRKFIVIAVVLTIILILGLLVSTIFALLNLNNNTILSGIYVGDTLIEGLTEEEAIKLLNDKLEEQLKKEIMLNINGEKFSITPEQIEVEFDVEKAVEQAYSIGRNGNIFENNYEILFSMLEENKIELEMKYNEKLLLNFLDGLNAKLPNALVDNTYCVEENELIITRGTDGIVIDTEFAKQEIIKNIRNWNNSELTIKTILKECPEIDIEKIYSEVKSEPQNATYIKEPFELIPHKNGIDFDIEKAKELLKEEKEEYVIKLQTIEPEILTNELGIEAFPDLLGSFSTKYDETNVPRSNNLKLATSKLDGVVVMPGEVFSYNKTLGKRTAEAGYEYANGFAGGKVVPMLAGGICQISSTLYDAVLYANLNIVERHNHMFQAQYVDPGKDATVVYGSLDFKFENTRNYPIMIKASARGGLAEIKIFGIREEVEYEVEIITKVLNYIPYKVIYQDDSKLAAGQQKVSQSGIQGCKSTTYRITKLNGQEVEREVLSTDTYDALDKIIKVGPTKTQSTVNTSTKPTTENKEEQKPTETPQEPEKVETENSGEQEQPVETPTEEPTIENPSTENQPTGQPSTEQDQNVGNSNEQDTPEQTETEN